MTSPAEFRLLSSCGLGDEVPHRIEANVPSGLNDWIEAIDKGDFKVVLDQEHFSLLTDPDTTLQEKRKDVERALHEAVGVKETQKCLELMILGVASLLTFVKHNVTGPEISSAGGGSDVTEALGMDGEDFLGKTRRPDLLSLARICLVEPLRLGRGSSQKEAAPSAALQIGDVTVELAIEDKPDVLQFVQTNVPTWLWWAARVTYMHQTFLKHSSATLRRDCRTLSDRLAEIVLGSEEWPTSFEAQLLLEMAQWEFQYRRSQAALQCIEKAEQTLGVSIELSGALGKRTVHQVDPKAQLIARIHRVNERSDRHASSQATTGEGENSSVSVPEEDVLLKPQWSEDVQPQELTLLEQCLALAKCDGIELGTTNDELKSWEMEPFAHIVQSQPTSSFIIQAKATLAKVRHERGRGRTRERALRMMEQLVERVRNGPGKDGRLSAVFAVRMPCVIRLRKQLAEHHVSFGMVASAMAAYEELELLDELVLCYRLLEKKAIADEIVSRQLQSDPRNSRLLCTLADLRSDPVLYLKAWEASLHKYPRAQRSLARCALERKDYKAAAHSFELALELNALHPDAWFSMGYCYLKLEDDTNALRAFTTCAQLELENGEAWNNLAALWMRRKKADRALRALKEAVKFKQNSWETWENYAKASVECNEYFLAIHGLTKVLDLTDGGRLQRDVLESLVLEYLDLARKAQTSAVPAAVDVEKLGSKLETLLRKASSASGWLPEFWILLSKVQSQLRQPAVARECLMKCFRHLQGSGWTTDDDKCALLSTVISEILESYRDTQVVKGDISSLRLQLQGIVKQAERHELSMEQLEKFQSLLSEAARLEQLV